MNLALKWVVLLGVLTVHAGFTGTGEMSLPLDVKLKLTELEELAKPLVLAPRK